ncbi:putative nuclease HARBI1, partial [Sitodiplosis mosellana]|uniref:putative nuclease HARBI1 n=1 Tax=Sitodiplosis mosellana TaxID=263140 RepID=UPI002444109F
NRNRYRFLMFFDDDDDDEVDINYRVRNYHPRINFNLPTPKLFRESFRVDRQVVECIERHIGQFIQRETHRSHALSVREQILIALHFLGNGSVYHLNGYSIGVTKSTVCKCVHLVCRLIMHHLMPQYVRWPTNPNDISARFARKAGFPFVMGCIDGTLIRINSPSGLDEAVYVSRDNKHSINLLLVSGPSHEFFFASARSPGSFHDARALRISSLWQNWEMNGWRPGNDNRSIILGDSAYPSTSWLMTPTIREPNRNIPHLQNAIEDYLSKHRKTRFMVERAIGILKQQFYCLRYGFRFVTPQRVSTAIYACITLHNMQNFFKHGSYDYDEELFRIANGEPNEAVDDGNPNQHDVAGNVVAIERQRQLLEYFAIN